MPRHVRAASARRAIPSDNFGFAELALSGLKNTAQQTARLVKTLPALASTLVGVLRANRKAVRETGAESADKTGWFGPRTPINVSITNQRLFSSFSCLPVRAARLRPRLRERLQDCAADP